MAYVYCLYFHGFRYDQTISQIDEQRLGMKINWYIPKAALQYTRRS